MSAPIASMTHPIIDCLSEYRTDAPKATRPATVIP